MQCMGDLEKYLHAEQTPVLVKAALAHVQNRPPVTIQKAADDTGLTRPTGATALRLLANLGKVRELTGKERHRLFVYSDYLTILSEGAMPTG